MIKWQQALLALLLFAGCKKAFNPPGILSDNNKYLVIEGIVNSGSDSTFIKLSRTKKFDTSLTVLPEVNAQASVESDGNAIYKLTEATPGTYTAAPLNLDATKKYRLRIKTSDKKEYVSDFVAVKSSPPIDSVGFKAQSAGVQIYVNSHDGSNATRYYRWDYGEDWQFHSFYQSFTTNHVFRTPDQEIYTCFANNEGSSILLANTSKLASDVVYQSPVAFITSTSEKIETKYSILVTQYALTADAYSFWQNLQTNTDRLGNIFDAQPSDNQTNFHCLSNPGELVVGYLSVGATSSKRIYITADQLLPTYKATYPYTGCKIDTVFFFQPRPTDPDLGDPKSGYTPIYLYKTAPTPPPGAWNLTLYGPTRCVDCTIRGTRNPPQFWK